MIRKIAQRAVRRFEGLYAGRNITYTEEKVVDHVEAAIREALATPTGGQVEAVSQHTPGPWEAAERGDYGDFDGESRVILGNDRRIAVVQHSGSKEDEANTEMIRRAPELLAENAALREEVERLKWDNKQAAISYNQTIDVLRQSLTERDAELARLREEKERLKEERHPCPSPLRDYVPQTYGDAINAGWLKGPECENHEWDNRTTAENARWMLERYRSELTSLRAEVERLKRRNEYLEEYTPKTNLGLIEELTHLREEKAHAQQYGDRQRQNRLIAEKERDQLRDRVKELDGVLQSARGHALAGDTVETLHALDAAKGGESREELEEGNFMPKVGGESFRCHCLCNVFRKVKGKLIYICNACDERYEGE